MAVAVLIMLLEEPPPQLTMISAITKIAAVASKSAPARGFRAIHRDFMLLLPSILGLFSFYLRRAGQVRRITDHLRAGFGS
jgi:hypothetical protein